jgi:hypothetical protein
MTTTNVIFGIAACAVLLPPRRTAQVLVNAAVVALALWVIQWSIYPTSRLLVADTTYDHWLLPSPLPTSIRTLVDLLVHSVVMPAAAVDRGAIPIQLNMHQALPGTGGLSGILATVLWVTLFGAGVSSLWRDRRLPHAMLLMVVTSGQLALHLVFAETQTFLFSPHFVSLLVLIAAWGSWRRSTNAIVPMAAVLFVAMAVANSTQWQRCLTLARTLSE